MEVHKDKTLREATEMSYKVGVISNFFSFFSPKKPYDCTAANSKLSNVLLVKLMDSGLIKTLIMTVNT